MSLRGVTTPRGVFSSLRGVTTPVGVFPAELAFQWGAVTGTTAGELLRVQYTGPTPASATITLADGHQLDMAIAAGEMSVLLPVDTPDGLATITTSDGATLELLLHGTVVVPPERPSLPSRPRRETPRRTVRSRSRLTLRSSTRVEARSHAAARLYRSSTRVRRGAPPPDRAVRVRSPWSTSSTARVSTTRMVGSRVALASSSRVGRRDGRDVEEALLLLL